VPHPETGAGPASRTPAFIGLATLGWGLAMLLGIMPHEDPIVGAGLAVFGLALLITRPGLPTAPRLPKWLVAGLGASAIVLVLGFRVAFDAAFDIQKVALLVLGAAVLAASPFLDRPIRLPVRGRPTVPLGSLVAWTLAAVGTPLAMWGIQATFKSLVGTTPTEAFVRIGLLPPVSAVLFLLGLHPSTSGQTISFATQAGLLRVDVGAACSGIQAMALFGAVLALYLIAERPGGRRLAFWGLIGIGGVYVTNLLRLTILMLVGYQWGAAALVQVHAQAGWVFFVAWALLFARLARTQSGRRVAPAAP